MENPQLAKNGNAGEHISPVDNVLGNMPSYEEHMMEVAMTPSLTEQDYSNSERQEVLSESELRSRFINEDYGKNGGVLKVPSPLSSTGAIQARFRGFQEKWDEVEKYSRRDLTGAEKLPELEKLIHEAKESLDGAKEVENKISNGEWNPSRIAEKYGHRVEKYGVSLADINRVLSKSWSVDDPSLVSNGIVFMPVKNESQPYEYFCKNISSVIEQHFSENTPEEHKQMMGSIIRKYINYEDNLENYLECLQEADPTTKVQEPEEINFSEEETELLAKEYADANRAAGNSINKIYLDDLRGGSTTGDKLLDGLMYGIYGGPNFDAAISIHDSEIGKRMQKYMN